MANSKDEQFHVTLEKEFASAEEGIRLSTRGRKWLGSLLLILGSSCGLILSLLLESRLGELALVEGETGVGNVTDGDDISGTGEVSEKGSSDGAVNLELFHDDGSGEAENLGHLLTDFGESLLIEENIGVELVLYLGLGPGLLLSLGSLSFSGLSALGGTRAFIFD